MGGDVQTWMTVAQAARVVAVLVAGGDQQRPDADHPGEPVLDPIRRPRILDAAREAIGNTEPALDLGEDQNAAAPHSSLIRRSARPPEGARTKPRTSPSGPDTS